MLTEYKEPTESYVDLGYWTSTPPNETAPLDDLSVIPPHIMSPHTTPLTDENLQTLDEEMSLDEETGIGATTASSVGSVHRAFHIMELNNIFLEKDDAKQRGNHIIQEAKSIVKGARYSVMSVSQSEELSKTTSEMSMDDELTFMVGVWSLVISTHRTVEYVNEVDKIFLVDRAWGKDTLKYNWRSPFAANITPPLRFADPYMEAFADWIPKLKESVPRRYSICSMTLQIRKKMARRGRELSTEGY